MVSGRRLQRRSPESPRCNSDLYLVSRAPPLCSRRISQRGSGAISYQSPSPVLTNPYKNRFFWSYVTASKACDSSVLSKNCRTHIGQVPAARTKKNGTVQIRVSTHIIKAFFSSTRGVGNKMSIRRPDGFAFADRQLDTDVFPDLTSFRVRSISVFRAISRWLNSADSREASTRDKTPIKIPR